MTVVFIALGSNIETEVNIQSALMLLKEQLDVRAVSPLYKSPALGRSKQADFINAVIKANSDFSAMDLKFKVLRKIESSLNRKRSADKFAARTIDLDLILFADEVYKTDDLTIPDPDISKRNFIYLPLLDIAPQITIPPHAQKLADIIDKNQQNPCRKI